MDSRSFCLWRKDYEVSDTGKESILVVDDTESNIDILVDMLGEDFDVRVAMDGRSALDQIAGEAPDLILLDIMMPGMNGIEVLEYLKKDQQLRHMPVIMISAVDEMKTVVHCIEQGAEDYLTKPFDPVLLRARIGASLDKKRFRDAEQQYLRTIMETQERLRKELSEAAAYVRSLLPEPLSGSITTSWRYIPSTQLGGDAFGYHWADDEHFVIYLLDVCGHGVGAALLSITIMNVIRSGSLPDTDVRNPGSVLRALNQRFQMDTQNDMFFTIWYGVYHRGTRQLTYGTAGHPAALLLSGPPGHKPSVQKLKTPNIPMGWDLDSNYDCAVCQCDSPSRLYVFSDGAYEIKKRDGSMQMYEEFATVVAAPSDDPSLDRIVRYARELQGSDSFEDDFSLLEIIFQ